MPGVCQNSGNCVNTEGSFMCACLPGFTGDRCESDVDECEEMPGVCQNSGVTTSYQLLDKYFLYYNLLPVLTVYYTCMVSLYY